MVFVASIFYLPSPAFGLEISNKCWRDNQTQSCPFIFKSISIGAYADQATMKIIMDSGNYQASSKTIEKKIYLDKSDDLLMTEEYNEPFGKLPASAKYILVSALHSQLIDGSFNNDKISLGVGCAPTLDEITDGEYVFFDKQTKSSLGNFSLTLRGGSPLIKTGDCYCRFKIKVADAKGNNYAGSISRPLLVCDNPPPTKKAVVKMDFTEFHNKEICFVGSVEQTGNAKSVDIILRAYPDIDPTKYLNGRSGTDTEDLRSGYDGKYFINNAFDLANTRVFKTGIFKICTGVASQGYCYQYVAKTPAGTFWSSALCGNKIFSIPQVQTLAFDYKGNSKKTLDTLSAKLLDNGYIKARSAEEAAGGNTEPARVWFVIKEKGTGKFLERTNGTNGAKGQIVYVTTGQKKQGAYCYQAWALNKAGFKSSNEICVSDPSTWSQTPPPDNPPKEDEVENKTPAGPPLPPIQIQITKPPKNAGYDSAQLEASVKYASKESSGWFWAFGVPSKVFLFNQTYYCSDLAKEIEAKLAALKTSGKNENSPEYLSLLAKYDLHLSVGLTKDLESGTYGAPLFGLQSATAYCLQARVKNGSDGKLATSSWYIFTTNAYKKTDIDVLNIQTQEEKLGSRIGSDYLVVEASLKDNGGDSEGEVYAWIYPAQKNTSGALNCNIELKNKDGSYIAGLQKGETKKMARIGENYQWKFSGLRSGTYYCYRVIVNSKAQTKSYYFPEKIPTIATFYSSDELGVSLLSQASNSAKILLSLKNWENLLSSGYKFTLANIYYSSEAPVSANGCTSSGMQEVKNNNKEIFTSRSIVAELKNLCPGFTYSIYAKAAALVKGSSPKFRSNDIQIIFPQVPPVITPELSQFTYNSGDDSAFAQYYVKDSGGGKNFRYHLKLVRFAGGQCQDYLEKRADEEFEQEKKWEGVSYSMVKLKFEDLGLNEASQYCVFLAVENTEIKSQIKWFIPKKEYLITVPPGGPKVEPLEQTAFESFVPETRDGSTVMVKYLAFKIKKIGDANGKIDAVLNYSVSCRDKGCGQRAFSVKKTFTNQAAGNIIKIPILQDDKSRTAEGGKFAYLDSNKKIILDSLTIANSSGAVGKLTNFGYFVFPYYMPNVGTLEFVSFDMEETYPDRTTNGFINYWPKLTLKYKSDKWGAVVKSPNLKVVANFMIDKSTSEALLPVCVNSIGRSSFVLTGDSSSFSGFESEIAPTGKDNTEITIVLRDKLRYMLPYCKYKIFFSLTNSWGVTAGSGNAPGNYSNGDKYPSVENKQVVPFSGGGDCTGESTPFIRNLEEAKYCNRDLERSCPGLAIINLFHYWMDKDNNVYKFMTAMPNLKLYNPELKTEGTYPNYWDKAPFVLNGYKKCDGTTAGGISKVNDRLESIDNALRGIGAAPLGLRAYNVIPLGRSNENLSKTLDLVYEKAWKNRKNPVPVSYHCCYGGGPDSQHYIVARFMKYAISENRPDDNDIIYIADSTCVRGNAMTRKQFIEDQHCGYPGECIYAAGMDPSTAIFYLDK